MRISLTDRFNELCARAGMCRICPDLADKTAVLSELNGSLMPRVLFLAEAPGRQGADRTRRPFYGDKSGANLQILLDSIGLSRDEIFITNSVLCSPRSTTDANRKPTIAEIRNCSSFLRRQIEIIDPSVVATLGSVALEALKAIESHALKLKTNAGTVNDWNGRKLVPLYHPSPQVIAMQRGLGLQLEHFQALRLVGE
ncbi:MAG TPA: uracil-DNA glycosylase [Pyrinomonadaceae bacterium]|nr:uracil-DNA glycosylase [Chloracidobacterium sp.]MBP9934677.1 uracil-DNA glycosylase [Pyrinomonadaceae bacterium]MBK7804617.1 uracil-DNA glycosylase [Chloracidobacterium sp.]MBK9439058.1 uracil-DNA glycosylase [Chloracidobacterium sp.]MBK9769165.1 uracil-DNA glycosylase [Chloracidobacterium sp.]